MEHSKIPGYIKTVYLSLLVIIIIFFMIMAKPILVPLLVSGYVAMLMTSFCNRLERWKIPRSLAAFAALLLCTVLMLAVLYLIGTQLHRLSQDLDANFQQQLDQVVMGLNRSVLDFCGFDIGLKNGLETKKIVGFINSGNTNIREMLAVTLGTLTDLLLLPIFIFFLLIYRDHLAHFVTEVFRKQQNHMLMEQIVSIRKIVHAYLMGAGKVMLILGVVNTAVLFALGIKHALFFGMLAGLLNIIPYLGPLFGATLPFFYALLTKDSLFYPVAVAASFTLIQLLESAFLTPRITGGNVNLNALITFLGLLIGGAIWGIVGMILIIPTLAILKKLFELSPETMPYANLFGEEHRKWFSRRT